MSDKTAFAGLNKIGTYLDEDLPKINENTDIIDAQLRQGHMERQAEAQTRAAADAALGEADAALSDDLGREANLRHEEDLKLLGLLATESRERQDAVSAEANIRADADAAEAQTRSAGDTANAAALQEHDGNAAAHDALIRRITVGDISPVIGVCWVETGNCTGLWYNVDENGQPITPNARYFDYHPVYSAMRRVLVDGQVMVENRPFWFRHFLAASGPFAGKLCKVISPEPREGFKPYPAFLNPDGSVMERLYIGAYQGTNEGGSPIKIGSRPGKLPIVSQTFPNMQAYCANRNADGVAGFRMWDFHHYSALCLLFLIEFCTTESQLVLGRGHADSSAANYTDAYNQPVWRGYAGLYGNVWQMVDGLRIAASSRKLELFRNDGSLAWVTTDMVPPYYNGSAPQYAITAYSGTGEGFDMNDVFVPASQGGYTAGSFPDYFYGSSGTAGNVLYVGGTWNNGSGAGLFCWNSANPASNAGDSVGCRLAKT